MLRIRFMCIQVSGEAGTPIIITITTTIPGTVPFSVTRAAGPCAGIIGGGTGPGDWIASIRAIGTRAAGGGGARGAAAHTSGVSWTVCPIVIAIIARASRIGGAGIGYIAAEVGALK